MNPKELWIWTELLAFDCTATDYGVGAYLARVGRAPTGISLLLSSIDFFLQHPGMERECPLPPDVCSRFGHAGNEERRRQAWTNYALRGLVHELHRHGVKVFGGFFIVSLQSRFHRETVADHPELRMADRVYGLDNAVSLLARLADGTLFEDLLIPAIVRACADYGLDGWHGADGQGPGWNLTHSDTSDSFFYQFAEALPAGSIPAELMAPADASKELLDRRLDFVWGRFHHEWAAFTSRRWVQLWAKATAALHAAGREVMINSPFAKSLFEGIYYFGLDYRDLGPLHIDYLLTESVVTSCALIYGGYERVFDFAAMIAEMRAALPGMKVIVMPGVKDVVESYDSLRHAPMRLERDIFATVSQSCFDGTRARRAADGCLVCLGDGISPEEWRSLTRVVDQCFAFDIAEAGDAGWLVAPELFDAMQEDYDRHGTWPPYQVPAQLCESEGLDLSCAVPARHLAQWRRPLVVPHFDLLSAGLQRAVLARREPTALFGNLLAFPALPEGAWVVCRTPIDPGCALVCVLLNGGAAEAPREIPNPARREGEFPWNRPYFRFIATRVPRMDIPVEFWHAAGAALRRAFGLSAEAPEGFRRMTARDEEGAEQLALLSVQDTYVKAKVLLPPETAVEKISAFPYAPVQVTADGLLALEGHLQPLHLPPQGLVLTRISHPQAKGANR